MDHTLLELSGLIISVSDIENDMFASAEENNSMNKSRYSMFSTLQPIRTGG